MKKSAVQKFLERISVSLEELFGTCGDWEADPCVEWEGSLINYGHNGASSGDKRYPVRHKIPYGIFQGRTAHSWAFNTFVRPVFRGEQVHHICRNPRCVRLSHLEAKTPKVHAKEHPRSGQKWGQSRWAEPYTPKRRYKTAQQKASTKDGHKKQRHHGPQQSNGGASLS